MSSSIIRCNSCGKLYRWSSSLAGTTVACKCGARLTVPSEPSARTERAGSTNPGASPAHEPSSPANAALRKTCPACGNEAVATAVLCACGYNFNRGRKPQQESDPAAQPGRVRGYALIAASILLVVIAGFNFLGDEDNDPASAPGATANAANRDPAAPSKEKTRGPADANAQRRGAHPKANTEPELRPLQNLHVFGLTDRACRWCDSLVPESALRLLAMNLAVRHETNVRFWSYNQQDSADAQAAFPRLEVSIGEPTRVEPRYLRLERKGDTFIASASDDGETYYSFMHRRVPMPRRVFVGPYLYADHETKKPVTLTLSDVTLNGKPLTPGETHDVGTPQAPGRIEFDDGTWTLRTFGTVRPAGDHTQHVVMSAQRVEGDFVMTGKWQSVDGHFQNNSGGLMARGALTTDAANACVTQSAGFGPRGRSKRKDAVESLPIFEPRNRQVTVRLHTAPNQRIDLVKRRIAFQTWPDIERDAVGLESAIRAALAERYRLDAEPLKPAEADAQQAQAIADVRKQSDDVVPSRLAEQAEKLSDLLNESPTLVDAHYAAARLGAMPAYQDLYGRFHNRGRSLAAPLSHYLFAKALDDEATAQQRFDAGWLIFACGFPAVAEQMIDDLPDALRDSPAGRALSMFITRDYRPLTPQTVLDRPLIEQAAWSFAVAECDRYDLMSEAPARMAVQRGTPALCTLHYGGNIGSDRRNTELAVRLSFIQDVVHLLKHEGISEQHRVKAAAELSRLLDNFADNDPRSAAEAIRQAAMTNGYEEHRQLVIEQLWRLYDQAVATPTGTQRDEGGLRFRVFSLHDYADLNRALFLACQFYRVQFLDNRLGVGQHASAMSAATGAALGDSVPGIFFKSFAYDAVNQIGQAPQFMELIKSHPGRSLRLVALVARYFTTEARELASARIGWPPARGTFEWYDMARGARGAGQAAEAVIASERAERVDPYARAKVFDYLDWYLDAREVADAARRRMPYHFGVHFELGNSASERGEYDRAIEILEPLLDLAPTDFTVYAELAYMYERMGRRDKAIETVKRAHENVEWSVGLSNLYASMPIWLLEAGEKEEALVWAQRAVQSGSGAGIYALGRALEANGRKQEAYQALLRGAQRYPSFAGYLVAFMSRNDYSAEQVEQVVAALIANAPQMRLRLSDSVIGDIRPEIVDRLHEGPLAFRPDEMKHRVAMDCALYGRRFDVAVKHARQYVALPDAHAGTLLRCHVAATFADDEQLLAAVARRLPKHVDDRELAWPVRFALGRATADELERGAIRKTTRAYAHWLRGVQAELAGDLEAARDAYQKAADVQKGVQGKHIPEHWLTIWDAGKQ